MQATPWARVEKQSASSPVIVTAMPWNSGESSIAWARLAARDADCFHIANGRLLDHLASASLWASLRFAPPISSPIQGDSDLDFVGFFGVIGSACNRRS